MQYRLKVPPYSRQMPWNDLTAYASFDLQRAAQGQGCLGSQSAWAVDEYDAAPPGQARPQLTKVRCAHVMCGRVLGHEREQEKHACSTRRMPHTLHIRGRVCSSAQSSCIMSVFTCAHREGGAQCLQVLGEWLSEKCRSGTPSLARRNTRWRHSHQWGQIGQRCRGGGGQHARTSHAYHTNKARPPHARAARPEPHTLVHVPHGPTSCPAGSDTSVYICCSMEALLKGSPV